MTATDPGKSLAICLTLFNEPASMLQSSLDSIVASLDALARSDPDYRQAAICIIADGAQDLSASALRYLEALGLDHAWPALEGFPGVQSERRVDGCLMAGMLRRSHPSDLTITIQLLVKEENTGKLDSHWWFYQRLCPLLDPDYCLQIDAGTVLETEAIGEIGAILDTHPEVAAVAGNVLIDPARNGSLLQTFQCADFAVQKTIRWPSEILASYLSVIPGQFSGARWHSLAHEPEDGSGAAKDRYLDGQSDPDAACRMRYLSEDRIFAFELAAGPAPDNRLAFAPRAVCRTDPCLGIAEFLHQRRRWLNGNLFCRAWMVGRIAEILADRLRRGGDKARFIPVLINLCVQGLLEWFLPFLTVLLLAVTWQSLGVLLPSGDSPPGLAFAVFAMLATLWVLPAALAASGRLQRWPRARVETLLWLAGAGFGTALGLNILALSGQLGGSASLYYLAMPLALAAAAFLGAALLNPALLHHLRRSILAFILLAPSLWLMLSVHAFANLKDGSWGTKGLQHGSGAGPLRGRLGGWIVSAWIITNALAVLMVLEGGHIPEALFVAGGIQAAMIAAGVLGAALIAVRGMGCTDWSGAGRYRVFAPRRSQ